MRRAPPALTLGTFASVPSSSSSSPSTLPTLPFTAQHPTGHRSPAESSPGRVGRTPPRTTRWWTPRLGGHDATTQPIPAPAPRGRPDSAQPRCRRRYELVSQIRKPQAPVECSPYPSACPLRPSPPSTSPHLPTSPLLCFPHPLSPPVCMFLKPVELLRCMEVSRFWARAIGRTQRLWVCAMGEEADAVLASHNNRPDQTSADEPPREAAQPQHETAAHALRAAAVAALREQWRLKFIKAEEQRRATWGASGGGSSPSGISLMRGTP